MFNFKNKTLAIAICAALSLFACSDNVNTPQNLKAPQEILKQSNIQIELEQKVSQMVKENSFQQIVGNDNSLKIQQYAIDTFRANNIRMEPTLENYRWYAGHELVPAWFEKTSPQEFEALLKSTDFLFNKKGEPIKKAVDIVKALFFLDDGSFLLDNASVENHLNILIAIDTLRLVLYPAVYPVDESGIINENFYFIDRLNKYQRSLIPVITIFAKEIIVNKKTRIDFHSENLKKDYGYLFKRN